MSGYDWQVTFKMANGEQKVMGLSGGDKGQAVNYGKEYAEMYRMELLSVRRIVNGVVLA
jgi:hypothetical protein